MSEINESGWSTYRPTKTVWFWSTVGASILTMVVGFTWGGWTTAGGAALMTDQAVRSARAELISDICVHNFASAANATENLKELKSKSSWEQDDFIENGGWAMVTGLSKPVPDAADTCADALVKLKELPSVAEAETSS
ncbi:hypothetical protein PZN02_004523 [Sinorhizobium garamanticum]|uniref:Uncharacterized protein n=1 Tax=Sinorhizobium garamanticum TaxID=680247 RepID=A0ABY8DMZ6_9HYPH|nr:hypothetical protein [Sinorhizobium garamanticum]WEX90940.1 hypothetical protein PZN02_004523 [Sinorhizobium garamanticum]